LQAFLKIPCELFIHDADLGTLLFSFKKGTLLFDIDKTRIAIRKAIREARDATTVSLPSLSDFSSNEETGELERVTLGDYGRHNNIDEVSQGFQPVNLVLFDIKHSVFSALRENQFSGS
jgi:hypothetical protein